MLSVLSFPFIASVASMLSSGRKQPFLATLVLVSVSLGLYVVLLAATGFGAETIGPFYDFYVDSFGLVLAGLALVIGVLVILYSYSYMSPENMEHPITEGWPRYYALLSLFIGSVIGVAFSANLLLLTAFYELTTLCSALLISFYGTRKATRAGTQAFILTTLGGFALLMATAATYRVAGSADLDALARLHGSYALAVGLLMLIAAWAKSAQLPFHIWLPDAMVAPTTVSAYLHAAAMVKVGAFVFLRYTQFALKVLEPGLAKTLGYIVLLDALATMFYGAISYYRANDLKKLLAYSTIVQLSIVFCALSLPYLQQSDRGLYAAAYHMWNHAYAKALLFLVVGAIAFSIGRRSIHAVVGLASIKEMRVVVYSWLAGSLAISAIPPFGCFFSKLSILFTGFKGPAEALAAVAIAFAESYLITLPVFLRISINMFKGRPETREPIRAKEPPQLVKLVLIALIIASLVSALAAPITMPTW